MKKILCIQISDKLINANNQKTLMDKYYKKLYEAKNKHGYFKPNKHFWEIPDWISEINYNIPVDLYICENILDMVNYLFTHYYDFVCFSALDVNKEIIKKIIREFNKIDLHFRPYFIVGGYCDLSQFDIDYTITFKTIQGFIEYLGIEYKQGHNYDIFKGFKTIPRLTLSKGCLHNCDFCTVEKKITRIPIHIIEQQIQSFKPLKFKLVYLNDKTFGQCNNYKILPKIYKKIKEYNKYFEGFIIQTTTFKIATFDYIFIRDSHIKYIELGIETVNEKILRKYNKANTVKASKIACEYIRELRNKYKLDVWLIPNILIGIPEENIYTYSNTLNFLNDNKDIISHMNIYNLAVYENTNLAKKLKHNNKNDSNEVDVTKSFHRTSIHKAFYTTIFKTGISMLSEV